jgi:hypothetical protein
MKSYHLRLFHVVTLSKTPKQKLKYFKSAPEPEFLALGIQHGFDMAPDFVLFQPTVTTLAIPLAEFANPEKAVEAIRAKLAQSGFRDGAE